MIVDAEDHAVGAESRRATVQAVIAEAAAAAARHGAEWCVVVTIGPHGTEVAGNLDAAPPHAVSEARSRVLAALGT